MAKTAKKETPKTEKTLRPPIVTIMGHVDHGKTSLLDAIRSTNVTAGESGGITQHTAAYTVEKDGKKIIFIDTPGHAAFTEMRRRGGAAADIVVLVVAADDGVMPQTKEAIMHAKLANVPIIVAINKIDLPGINKDKIKKQLSDNGIILEEYGGDVVVVETSAVKNIGIDKLLDMISLVTEMRQGQAGAAGEINLEADINAPFEALVIEAKHSKKQGNIVSAIIKNGKVDLRDELAVLSVYKGPKTPEIINVKIKALQKLEGNVLKNVPMAKYGDVVEILGFNQIPLAGEIIRPSNFDFTEAQDKLLKDSESTVQESSVEIDKKKVLNLVVRADTAGTLEALISSLKKLKYEDVTTNILLSGTGDIKESDILLASSSKAIVLAFRVKVDSFLHKIATDNKIIVGQYDIIYKLIEDIEGALEGVVEIEEERIKGRGLIIKLFTLPKSNMKVAGTLVIAGRFKVNQRVSIYRGEAIPGQEFKPLYYTKIRSIHEGTKEVDVSNKGSECGLLFKPEIADLQLDDRIEVL